MATNVLLTIDTELRWSRDVAHGAWQDAFDQSYDPAGVGVPYQLVRLAEHKLKAVFFIDPMPALHFGIDPVKRMVAPILEAGQSIELHLHPQWARLVDGEPSSSFELNDYSEDEQIELIRRASDLLMEAGAGPPVAFRAGSYAANDATLRAAGALGLRYDSSHNGSEHPWPSAIALPPRQIAPVAHQGVVEIPISLIKTTAGYRHLQICAVSLGEMRAALDHAAAHRHPVVTIVSHSFELAARSSGRVNRTHRRRFDGLCAYLARHRDRLPTRTFVDLDLQGLDAPAEPLPSSRWRAIARKAEQIWSNFVEERTG